MKDGRNQELLHGPYATPKCRVGDRLDCEALGEEVVVGGLHDGPILWPYRRKKGMHSLIVCGDLLRAIPVESVRAIMYHWGVSASTVWKWRVALGVGKWTEGSTRLILGCAAEARKASRNEASRAKMSASRAGKPLSPQFLVAARAAAGRPKSDAWKRTMSERMKDQWASGARRIAFGKVRPGR